MPAVSTVAEQVPYQGKRVLLVQDHTTGDIVKAIKSNHRAYDKDYDQIADMFQRADPGATAEEIFVFLKKNVKYDIEPEENQSVKSPGAIVAQRHGDCKHYASFINGVCCSLERQGYPIHARYRFVSDLPSRQIHHVFAVVTDKNTGEEYWVDPVLSRYNEQPRFYNTKDVEMSNIGELYAISGRKPRLDTGAAAVEPTYPGGPLNLPQVWGIGKAKKKKTNVFKKIAHGIKVNQANAAKGVKKLATEAKNVVLKVSIAPARNSLLALLDFNMFNLATRLADSWNNPKKKAGLVKMWTNIGGDVNKLRNAINNGIKHKASVHHQAPAKRITGSSGRGLPEPGDLSHYLKRHIEQTRRGHAPIRHVYHPEFSVKSWGEAYQYPADDLGNHPRVKIPGMAGVGCGCGCNNQIGCLPVCAPALLALATALIAALKPFLSPSPGDDKAMVKGAHAGVHGMVTDASDAIDMANAGGAPGKHKKAKGGTLDADVAAGDTPMMDISTGTDPETGDPIMQVNAVDHPQINNAGQYIPGSSTQLIDPNASDPGSAGEDGGPDPSAPNSLVNIPANTGKDFMRDIIGPIKDQVEQIWNGYKVPIMAVGAGVVVYKIYKSRGKKGRKR
jgi:hypothetical protein